MKDIYWNLLISIHNFIYHDFQLVFDKIIQNQRELNSRFVESEKIHTTAGANFQLYRLLRCYGFKIKIILDFQS